MRIVKGGHRQRHRCDELRQALQQHIQRALLVRTRSSDRIQPLVRRQRSEGVHPAATHMYLDRIGGGGSATREVDRIELYLVIERYYTCFDPVVRRLTAALASVFKDGWFR